MLSTGSVPAEPPAKVTALPAVLHTPAEAAERLRMVESTLRTLARARKIPHTRIGRRICFSEADLAEIIRLHNQPALTGRGRQRAA